ncbi:hypothetical protein AVEN_247138-1 [Araneus ventricosus]|uniref:Uncharacterized protein n=1 Tax=Araneus ventricosus TaxID=182803 RepID=A0A4Y2UMC7_ARAVE|nr:hypothetical protein AVEN_247138-1 [Araneus ventricosus]
MTPSKINASETTPRYHPYPSSRPPSPTGSLSFPLLRNLLGFPRRNATENYEPDSPCDVRHDSSFGREPTTHPSYVIACFPYEPSGSYPIPTYASKDFEDLLAILWFLRPAIPIPACAWPEDTVDDGRPVASSGPAVRFPCSGMEKHYRGLS